MKISVVIPCHDSLRFLPATLKTVLTQDLPPHIADGYEVILVDDGGSDDLKGWASKLGDERVKVVRQANAGVSAARNLGIRSAGGELIAFCDSDDLWTANTVASLARAFGEDPQVGLTFGGYDIVDADGAPTGHREICDWKGYVWDRLIMGNTISASVVMVRREVFDDVGYFAENRDRFPVDVEDWELWLRIADRWKVASVTEVLMHCRRHDSNSSLNVESLESAYANLLDVAFADGDEARAALRPRATANVQIRIASMWLNDRRSSRRALVHLREAVAEFPQVRRDGEYLQILVGAWVLKLFGHRGFETLRRLNTEARRVISRRS